MQNKKIKELYYELIKNTVEYLNNQKTVHLDDLISLSSALICFAVDLIRNNTDLDSKDIYRILKEALDLSFLPPEELDKIAEEDNEEEETIKIDKKNLN